MLCANTLDMQHIPCLHGIEVNGDNPHDAVDWTDHSMFYEFEGTHVTGDPVQHRIGIVGTSMYFQSRKFAGRWFGLVAPFGLPRPGQSMCVDAQRSHLGAFLRLHAQISAQPPVGGVHPLKGWLRLEAPRAARPRRWSDPA